MMNDVSIAYIALTRKNRFIAASFDLQGLCTYLHDQNANVSNIGIFLFTDNGARLVVPDYVYLNDDRNGFDFLGDIPHTWNPFQFVDDPNAGDDDGWVERLEGMGVFDDDEGRSWD